MLFPNLDWQDTGGSMIHFSEGSAQNLRAFDRRFGEGRRSSLGKSHGSQPLLIDVEGKLDMVLGGGSDEC